MHVLKSLLSDMGINLGAGQVTMAQQQLNHPKIGAMVQKVRGKGMS